MKWIELTEFTTGEKVIVNIEKVDFMVRVEDVTSIRINGDEFSVSETPDQVVELVTRSAGRKLND